MWYWGVPDSWRWSYDCSPKNKLNKAIQSQYLILKSLVELFQLKAHHFVVGLRQDLIGHFERAGSTLKILHFHPEVQDYLLLLLHLLLALSQLPLVLLYQTLQIGYVAFLWLLTLYRAGRLREWVLPLFLNSFNIIDWEIEIKVVTNFLFQKLNLLVVLLVLLHFLDYPLQLLILSSDGL